VRRTQYRLADDIHGIGFLTADSLWIMLGIAPTSPLHAALKYAWRCSWEARRPCYLPLAELADRTARQLDDGELPPAGEPNPDSWPPSARMCQSSRALRMQRRARRLRRYRRATTRVYSRAVRAECTAATCPAQLLGQDTPLFKAG
jgi:hypothetical protein